MAESVEYFNDVRDIFEKHFLIGDQPDTFSGRVVKIYSVLRQFTAFAMILVAISQIYFYGISYLVHDSIVLVPLGVVTFPVNVHTMLNFNRIVNTASTFRSLIDSFPKHERDIIDKELQDNKTMTRAIVKALDYYVTSTGYIHFASISIHYFFGIPKKPVVLPLLYEKFLEGNLELRPMLIAVVVLSVAYVNIISGYTGYFAASLYAMKAPVGIMKALTHRLETITESAGHSSERLSKHMELGDTVRKHGELLEAVRDMTSWNAFPLAYTITASTILFCLNAITFKQSLKNNEYSSALVWGTFLILIFVIVYVFCSQAQEVELESEILVTAIYGLPWFRESPNGRRDVLQMITQGNRLIKLNYRRTTDINMAKYSEVVQTAYSYFMLLSSAG